MGIEADADGSGLLSPDEFKDMMASPRAKILFKELSVDIREVVTLYNLLSADDGAADFEEFMEGLLTMKNQCMEIHAIQILHQSVHANIAIGDLAGGLHQI